MASRATSWCQTPNVVVVAGGASIARCNASLIVVNPTEQTHRRYGRYSNDIKVYRRHDLKVAMACIHVGRVSLTADISSSVLDEYAVSDGTTNLEANAVDSAELGTL